MIADDEDHVRQYMRAVMERMNADVIAEAADGISAVKGFLKQRPHMLLLDINMPKMSGRDALKEIITRKPNAFVIMLTSLADKETIEECLDLGASGYIRKDISPEAMRDVIKTAWRAYKARRAAQKKGGAAA